MQINSDQFTFKRAERLKSKKVIELLFKEGESKVIFPFRVVWLSLPLDSPAPAQFAASVSSRHFKKAVDRNHIKRQIKEAYRLNKHILYQSLNAPPQKQLAIMIIFIAKKKLPYSFLSYKLIKIVRFLSKLNQNG